MRLHRLELTAFGPYADTQVVDFDSLNEAGVFLLTGPTGAGKTSILDAVCFALYGVVPGDREVRGLRSDHAPVGLRPCVDLELTLRGRRLRVVRSPAWQRPRKRGEGLTPEPARARLFELEPDGTERLVSDRAQEVGHELGPLLGITSEQFMQVVLLPQGGFQSFLTADSDGRQAVLEKLFATQRFGRIETWMHDRARELRAGAEAARLRVDRVTTRLVERSGEPLPATVRLDRVRPDDAAALRSWSEALVGAAEAAHRDRATTLETLTHEAALAEEADRAASRLHDLVQRRDAALQEQSALDDSAAQAQDDAERLDRDERARQVLPLVTPLRLARRRAAEAEQTWVRARDALAAHAPPPDGPETETLEAETSRLRRLADELAAHRTTADDLTAATGTGRATSVELDEARASLAAVRDELAGLPAERAELDAAIATAGEVLATRPSAEATLADLVTRRAAAEELVVVRAALVEAEHEERRAHDEANASRSRALDLLARRLEGIAAELAGRLQPDEPCAVCGSVEHPRPADPGASPVTADDVAAADAAADAARRTLEGRRSATAELRSTVSVLLERAGGLGPDDAALAEQEARDRLAAMSTAEDTLRALVERRGTLDRREAETRGRHDRQTASVGQLEARLEEAQRRAGEAATRLRTALDAGPDVADADLPATLTERVRRTDRHRRLVDTALEAHRRREETAASLTELADQADHVASGAGFTDVDAALAALLDDPERDLLGRRRTERRQAVARVAAVLDDPAVAELGDRTPEATATALAETRRRADAARGVAAGATASCDHLSAQARLLRDLSDELDRELRAWAPVAEESDLVGGLADLVRGRGDNQRRMRLSSYVLATRLDQVLAAANARLRLMRDSRYVLERTEQGRRASSQAGLDLVVLDEWTGERRPPTSLSGGETFVVSLALALGLADVIGEEAGGIEVDTLFVDEGFGTLDPDTLDQVMDRIDELRSGGRAVGVVSHVTELRHRITTQVHVRPSRTGSTIELTTVGA